MYKTFRTDTAHLVAVRKDLGLTTVALAELLHVSSNAISKWVKNNDAPKWTLIAVEGLRRRVKNRSNQPEVFVVTVKSGNELDAFVSFCTALSIDNVRLGSRDGGA